MEVLPSFLMIWTSLFAPIAIGTSNPIKYGGTNRGISEPRGRRRILFAHSTILPICSNRTKIDLKSLVSWRNRLPFSTHLEPLCTPVKMTIEQVHLSCQTDGKIVHETHYYADPFEPPKWRSQWIEKIRWAVKSEDKYNKESGFDIAGDTIKTVFHAKPQAISR